jgi:glutamate-1-semialdehyde 2,1-aminomutase
VRDDLAAIIVEPVQRSIEPRDGFLDELRALCDDTGALLIFDEVVTGFRIAVGGAEERYGVRPDLSAMGKVLGGGLPLAAVAGRLDVLELADPSYPVVEQRVYLSGTLNGNPLAAVAGLATLEVLVDEDVPAQLARTGTMLAEELVSLAQERSIELRFIGPPSFLEPLFGDGDVVDYRSYTASDRATAMAFGRELLRRGVFVNPGNKLYMSSTLGEDEMTRVLEAAAGALDVIREGRAV